MSGTNKKSQTKYLAWFIIVNAWRERTLLYAAGIFWLLLLAAMLSGYRQYSTQQAARQQANTLFRQQWEQLEANPHSAAHYGTYLFRTFSVLNLFENGLNNYTGIVYRVEAHKQHEPGDAIATDSDATMRFGELTVAMLLQLLAPLLIIFLSADAITRERVAGTLPLLLAQGLSPGQLFRGKLWGHFLLALIIVCPALLLLWGSLFFTPFNAQLLGRMLLMTLGYLAYLWIITALAISISAISRQSRSAILLSLGCWVMGAILLPRITTDLADRQHPLPSRYALSKNISEGYSKGLPGEEDMRSRMKSFQKLVLAKYKVDSLSQLPVNFDGLQMQASEEYNSKVYSIYIAQLDSIMRRQQNTQEWWGFLDPLLPLQQLWWNCAGTDYAHQADFHRQARRYRDEFVRTLNMKLANSGSPSGSYEYKARADFFAGMDNFNYSLPSFLIVVKNAAKPLAALVCWLLITVLLIRIIPAYFLTV